MLRIPSGTPVPFNGVLSSGTNLASSPQSTAKLPGQVLWLNSLPRQPLCRGARLLSMPSWAKGWDEVYESEDEFGTGRGSSAARSRA